MNSQPANPLLRSPELAVHAGARAAVRKSFLNADVPQPVDQIKIHGKMFLPKEYLEDINDVLSSVDPERLSALELHFYPPWGLKAFWLVHFSSEMGVHYPGTNRIDLVVLSKRASFKRALIHESTHWLIDGNKDIEDELTEGIFDKNGLVIDPDRWFPSGYAKKNKREYMAELAHFVAYRPSSASLEYQIYRQVVTSKQEEIILKKIFNVQNPKNFLFSEEEGRNLSFFEKLSISFFGHYSILSILNGRPSLLLFLIPVAMHWAATFFISPDSPDKPVPFTAFLNLFKIFSPSAWKKTWALPVKFQNVQVDRIRKVFLSILSMTLFLLPVIFSSREMIGIIRDYQSSKERVVEPTEPDQIQMIKMPSRPMNPNVPVFIPKKETEDVEINWQPGETSATDHFPAYEIAPYVFTGLKEKPVRWYSFFGEPHQYYTFKDTEHPLNEAKLDPSIFLGDLNSVEIRFHDPVELEKYESIEIYMEAFGKKGDVFFSIWPSEKEALSPKFSLSKGEYKFVLKPSLFGWKTVHAITVDVSPKGLAKVTVGGAWTRVGSFTEGEAPVFEIKKIKFVGKTKSEFGARTAERISQPELPQWSEQEEQFQAKALHQKFERFALDYLNYILEKPFIILPKDVYRNDWVGGRFQQMMNGFYRLSLPFDEFLNFAFYGWAVPDISREEYLNYKQSYETLRHSYQIMIHWAIKGRLKLANNEDKITLYRGTYTEHQKNRYEKSIGGLFASGGLFLTESLEVAKSFYQKGLRFEGQKKWASVEVHEVAIENFRGYWRLYPESIGYPKAQQEYNAGGQFIFKKPLKILKDFDEINNLPVNSLNLGARAAVTRRNFLTGAAIAALNAALKVKGQNISPSLDSIRTDFSDSLRKTGMLGEPIPLYDLSNPTVRQIYQNQLKTAKPAIQRRDETSWREIKNAVDSHIKNYPENSLIIIDGGATHLWGAVPDLVQDYRAGYISASSVKINPEILKTYYAQLREKPSDKEIYQKIETQIQRDVEVIKSLGFESLEDFVQAQKKSSGIHHLIIGIEQTGMHAVYLDYNAALFILLENLLKEQKPSSILFIGEDLRTETVREGLLSNFSGRALLPRDKFLLAAKQRNIPIRLGAFGIENQRSMPLEYKPTKPPGARAAISKPAEFYNNALVLNDAPSGFMQREMLKPRKKSQSKGARAIGSQAGSRMALGVLGSYKTVTKEQFKEDLILASDISLEQLLKALNEMDHDASQLISREFPYIQEDFEQFKRVIAQKSLTESRRELKNLKRYFLKNWNHIEAARMVYKSMASMILEQHLKEIPYVYSLFENLVDASDVTWEMIETSLESWNSGAPVSLTYLALSQKWDSLKRLILDEREGDLRKIAIDLYYLKAYLKDRWRDILIERRIKFLESKIVEKRKSYPTVPGEDVQGKLRQMIEDSLEKRISFETFHKIAGKAYYASHAKIDFEGKDFETDAGDPQFAKLLAKHIQQVWKRLGSPPHFKVLEMGAGSGAMAFRMMHAIQYTAPALYEKMEYVIVEQSNRLIEEQQVFLEEFSGKVRWIHASALDFNEAVDGGVIISNELPDAFPVEKIRTNQSGQIEKAYVSLGPDGFVEIWSALSNGDDAIREYVTQLTHLRGPDFVETALRLPGGIQVHLNAKIWLENISRNLKKGSAITLDYGLGQDNPDLSGRTQPFVRGYKNGFEIEAAKIYQSPGTVDITSDVDFKILEAWGQKLGFDFQRILRKEEFFEQLTTTKEFIGRVFGVHVLVQERNIPVGSEVANLAGARLTVAQQSFVVPIAKPTPLLEKAGMPRREFLKRVTMGIAAGAAIVSSASFAKGEPTAKNSLPSQASKTTKLFIEEEIHRLLQSLANGDEEALQKLFQMFDSENPNHPTYDSYREKTITALIRRIWYGSPTQAALALRAIEKIGTTEAFLNLFLNHTDTDIRYWSLRYLYDWVKVRGFEDTPLFYEMILRFISKIHSPEMNEDGTRGEKNLVVAIFKRILADNLLNKVLGDLKTAEDSKIVKTYDPLSLKLISEIKPLETNEETPRLDLAKHLIEAKHVAEASSDGETIAVTEEALASIATTAFLLDHVKDEGLYSRILIAGELSRRTDYSAVEINSERFEGAIYLLWNPLTRSYAINILKKWVSSNPFFSDLLVVPQRNTSQAVSRLMDVYSSLAPLDENAGEEIRSLLLILLHRKGLKYFLNVFESSYLDEDKHFFIDLIYTLNIEDFKNYRVIQETSDQPETGEPAVSFQNISSGDLKEFVSNAVSLRAGDRLKLRAILEHMTRAGMVDYGTLLLIFEKQPPLSLSEARGAFTGFLDEMEKKFEEDNDQKENVEVILSAFRKNGRKEFAEEELHRLYLQIHKYSSSSLLAHYNEMSDEYRQVVESFGDMGKSNLIKFAARELSDEALHWLEHRFNDSDVSAETKADLLKLLIHWKSTSGLIHDSKVIEFAFTLADDPEMHEFLASFFENSDLGAAESKARFIKVFLKIKLAKKFKLEESQEKKLLESSSVEPLLLIFQNDPDLRIRLLALDYLKKILVKDKEDSEKELAKIFDSLKKADIAPLVENYIKKEEVGDEELKAAVKGEWIRKIMNSSDSRSFKLRPFNVNTGMFLEDGGPNEEIIKAYPKFLLALFDALKLENLQENALAILGSFKDPQLITIAAEALFTDKNKEALQIVKSRSALLAKIIWKSIEYGVSDETMKTMLEFLSKTENAAFIQNAPEISTEVLRNLFDRLRHKDDRNSVTSVLKSLIEIRLGLNFDLAENILVESIKEQFRKEEYLEPFILSLRNRIGGRRVLLDVSEKSVDPLIREEAQRVLSKKGARMANLLRREFIKRAAEFTTALATSPVSPVSAGSLIRTLTTQSNPWPQMPSWQIWPGDKPWPLPANIMDLMKERLRKFQNNAAAAADEAKKNLDKSLGISPDEDERELILEVLLRAEAVVNQGMNDPIRRHELLNVLDGLLSIRAVEELENHTELLDYVYSRLWPDYPRFKKAYAYNPIFPNDFYDLRRIFESPGQANHLIKAAPFIRELEKAGFYFGTIELNTIADRAESPLKNEILNLANRTTAYFGSARLRFETIVSLARPENEKLREEIFKPEVKEFARQLDELFDDRMVDIGDLQMLLSYRSRKGMQRLLSNKKWFKENFSISRQMLIQLIDLLEDEKASKLIEWLTGEHHYEFIDDDLDHFWEALAETRSFDVETLRQIVSHFERSFGKFKLEPKLLEELVSLYKGPVEIKKFIEKFHQVTEWSLNSGLLYKWLNTAKFFQTKFSKGLVDPQLFWERMAEMHQAGWRPWADNGEELLEWLEPGAPMVLARRLHQEIGYQLRLEDLPVLKKMDKDDEYVEGLIRLYRSKAVHFDSPFAQLRVYYDYFPVWMKPENFELIQSLHQRIGYQIFPSAKVDEVRAMDQDADFFKFLENLYKSTGIKIGKNMMDGLRHIYGNPHVKRLLTEKNTLETLRLLVQKGYSFDVADIEFIYHLSRRSVLMSRVQALPTIPKNLTQIKSWYVEEELKNINLQNEVRGIVQRDFGDPLHEAGGLLAFKEDGSLQFIALPSLMRGNRSYAMRSQDFSHAVLSRGRWLGFFHLHASGRLNTAHFPSDPGDYSYLSSLKGLTDFALLISADRNGPIQVRSFNAARDLRKLTEFPQKTGARTANATLMPAESGAKIYKPVFQAPLLNDATDVGDRRTTVISDFFGARLASDSVTSIDIAALNSEPLSPVVLDLARAFKSVNVTLKDELWLIYFERFKRNGGIRLVTENGIRKAIIYVAKGIIGRQKVGEINLEPAIQFLEANKTLASSEEVYSSRTEILKTIEPSAEAFANVSLRQKMAWQFVKGKVTEEINSQEMKILRFSRSEYFRNLDEAEIKAFVSDVQRIQKTFSKTLVEIVDVRIENGKVILEHVDIPGLASREEINGLELEGKVGQVLYAKPDELLVSYTEAQNIRLVPTENSYSPQDGNNSMAIFANQAMMLYGLTISAVKIKIEGKSRRVDRSKILEAAANIYLQLLTPEQLFELKSGANDYVKAMILTGLFHLDALKKSTLRPIERLTLEEFIRLTQLEKAIGSYA